MSNPLLNKKFFMTPEGEKLRHEALIRACNDLSTTHVALCDTLDGAACDAIRPVMNLTDEQRSEFAEAVVETVEWFLPPDRKPGQGGYFWNDPDNVDVNDVVDLQNALAAHAERCLALGFLLAMSEAGDL